MTENEKLRALLAEARRELGCIEALTVHPGVHNDPGGDALFQFLARIDAALAEPVGECAGCVTVRAAFHDATRLRSAIQQARIKAEKERDEARAEVKRLEERLQFDPGGSDRIDELEEALQYFKAEIDHWKGAAREHAENLTKMQAERDHMEVLWKAEMEHANKWAARARKAESDFSYMDRIRNHLQGEMTRLQWEREAACENTPTKGCECPGCCVARERAERGEA